jgi:hypothetical protein
MIWLSPWSDSLFECFYASCIRLLFVVRESFMRLSSQFLAVGCLSFFSLASHAEILTGLYQVREPVSQPVAR